MFMLRMLLLAGGLVAAFVIALEVWFATGAFDDLAKMMAP